MLSVAWAAPGGPGHNSCTNLSLVSRGGKQELKHDARSGFCCCVAILPDFGVIVKGEVVCSLDQELREPKVMRFILQIKANPPTLRGAVPQQHSFRAPRYASWALTMVAQPHGGSHDQAVRSRFSLPRHFHMTSLSLRDFQLALKVFRLSGVANLASRSRKTSITATAELPCTAWYRVQRGVLLGRKDQHLSFALCQRAPLLHLIGLVSCPLCQSGRVLTLLLSQLQLNAEFEPPTTQFHPLPGNDDSNTAFIAE